MSLKVRDDLWSRTANCQTSYEDVVLVASDFEIFLHARYICVGQHSSDKVIEEEGYATEGLP